MYDRRVTVKEVTSILLRMLPYQLAYDMFYSNRSGVAESIQQLYRTAHTGDERQHYGYAVKTKYQWRQPESPRL